MSGDIISSFTFANVAEDQATRKKWQATRLWRHDDPVSGRRCVYFTSPILEGDFFVDEGGQLFIMEPNNYAFPSGKIHTAWTIKGPYHHE